MDLGNRLSHSRIVGVWHQLRGMSLLGGNWRDCAGRSIFFRDSGRVVLRAVIAGTVGMKVVLIIGLRKIQLVAVVFWRSAW